MTASITQDRLEEILEATTKLAKRQVLIGVPDINAGRDDTSEVSNAAIAYWMEFGVPEKNIPARPSIIPGVQSMEQQNINRLRKAGEGALDRQPEKTEAQFEAIGLENVSAVRMKIRSGPFVPLAPSTIAARARSDMSKLDELYKHDTIASDQHAALTGVQPLIDTAKFLQSINYVIRNK